MINITYVPLTNDLLVRLIERYQGEYHGVIENVIESFLERTEDDWDFQPPSKKGYTWDQLFLPDGTELRTKYRQELHVATIENGKVSYNGELFDSPAQVCNAMRGDTSNNAWITLEVKRPQDIAFRLADKHRG